jgi:hypothetical protein
MIFASLFLVMRPADVLLPMGHAGMKGWAQDLFVPLSAAAALLWPIPLCIVLLSIYWTGLPLSPTRMRGEAEEIRRPAAEAMARYAAAPLAWLIWGALLLVIAMIVLKYAHERVGDNVLVVNLIVFSAFIVSGLIFLAAPILAIRRAAQWIARAHLGGATRSLVAAAECSIRLLIGIVACFFVVPWCVGLIWIIIDSMR